MDLHRLFDEWLAAGAEGEPGRDLALHASGCEECLRAVAAMDSLQAIDVGAAPPPPLSRVSAGQAGSGPAGGGYAVGVIAVVLGIGFAVGASGLLAPRDPGTGTEDAGLRSPAGDVLGGGPSDRASLEPASEEPSPSPSPTPSPTDEPSPSEEATAAPVVAPPPAPGTPAPQPLPQPTPQPTAAPTAAPPPPPPAPTPSASPTIPIPTPTPLPACSNLIDDDGDELTDFPADPGCTSIDDDSEVDPEPTP